VRAELGALPMESSEAWLVEMELSRAQGCEQRRGQ